MPDRPAVPGLDAALATLREMLPSMEGHEDNCPCSVGKAHAALAHVKAELARLTARRSRYAEARYENCMEALSAAEAELSRLREERDDLAEQVRLRDLNAFDGASIARVIDARDAAEAECARLREERDAARTWFEEDFVDEDGEPAGLTLAEMLEHVFKWGDGAWYHAGAAEARCARLQQALAALYDPASQLADPSHELTEIEWYGVMSRLRAAVGDAEREALAGPDKEDER